MFGMYKLHAIILKKYLEGGGKKEAPKTVQFSQQLGILEHNFSNIFSHPMHT